MANTGKVSASVLLHVTASEENSRGQKYLVKIQLVDTIGLHNAGLALLRSC